MAEYLVLIYGDEQAIEAGGRALSDQLMAEHGEFGENYGAALRGGNALQPAAMATAIRRRDDGTATATSGPFAQTTEVLGGYYLIEATDLDEAVSIAGQVPAPFGGVEVRPVMVFE